MNLTYHIVLTQGSGIFQVATDNASPRRTGKKRLILPITSAIVLAAFANTSAAQGQSRGGDGGAPAFGPAAQGGSKRLEAGEDGTASFKRGQYFPTGASGGGGGGGADAPGGAGSQGVSPPGLAGAGGNILDGNDSVGGKGRRGTDVMIEGVNRGPGASGGGGGGSAVSIGLGNYNWGSGVTLRGGDAGRGGLTMDNSGAGGGGAGGYGLILHSGPVTATSAGAILGGEGGRGGASASGAAGSGGDGGVGAHMLGDSRLTNTGSIVGGNGGTGGDSGQGGSAGHAGKGGKGVAMRTRHVLVNYGSISGGAGAAPGSAATARGTGGAGGVGIFSTFGANTIINAGSVSGGMGHDGVRADAIVFRNDRNTLELRNGYDFNGNVIGSGYDTLRLGGNQDFAFNMSAVAHTAPATGGSTQYYGFRLFEKSGTNTVTLTGSTPARASWAIQQGTLALDSEASLGTSGALTLDGGTLRWNNAFDLGSARDVRLLTRGANFDTNGHDVAIEGRITASGGLAKLGSGDLALADFNDYAGDTTIKGGTLTVGGDASLGIPIGRLTLDGGTLRWGHNFDLAISRPIALGSAGGGLDTNGHDTSIWQTITGNGGLIKSGAGTLTLHGSNSYAGGTIIKGGALDVRGGDSALGEPTGSVTIDGGTLKFTKNAEVAPTRTITLGAAGGTIEVGDTGTEHTAVWVEPGIGGPGGLTKTGPGRLLLLGHNTYTGNTVVASGELTIGNGVPTGNIPGDVHIADGALLTVNHPDDYAYAGHISGAGTLRQSSSNGLILTGNNDSFTGLTRIDRGYVKVGNGGTSGSIAGPVHIGAFTSLVFKRSDDATYGGTITGSGRVRQLGTGTLTLTGDSSAYAGTTTINAGTLQVDNKLGGRLHALSGGTLTGIGQVGSTQIDYGASLAPGNAAHPTATLAINGDLTMHIGSTLRVLATPNGDNGKLAVAGTANLYGAVLQVATSGTYAASTTYNILRAGTGVAGTFQSVSSNHAFLQPYLTYGPDKVDLVINLKQVPADPGGGNTGTGSSGLYNVGTGTDNDNGKGGTGDNVSGNGGPGNSGTAGTRNGRGSTRPIRFADLANTSNQRSVANALQSLPNGNGLHTRVLNLPNGAPAAVFQSMTGEAHAATSNTLNGVSNTVGTLPMAHLRANINAGQTAGRPTAQLGRGDASALPESAAQPAWAQVFGNWRTLGSRGNTAEVRESDGGLFVGGDQGVGAGWRLGGALGYTGSHASIKGLSSSTDIDSYSGVIYGGKAFQAGPGKIDFTLGASYTWHDIDTRRNVNAAGNAQALKASYGASTSQLFTELGYAVPLTQRITLEPFLGADYSDQRTRSFSESGGDAALHGASNHNRVGSNTLGLRLQSTFESGASQGRLYASTGWRHSYGDLDARTTMAFDASQPFSVAGAPIARDAALVSLGADIAVTRNTTVGLAYAGQFGGGSRQNSGTVDVRWRF
jgi:autotransporter-associated beta strand protein